MLHPFGMSFFFQLRPAPPEIKLLAMLCGGVARASAGPAAHMYQVFFQQKISLINLKNEPGRSAYVACSSDGHVATSGTAQVTDVYSQLQEVYGELDGHAMEHAMAEGAPTLHQVCQEGAHRSGPHGGIFWVALRTWAQRHLRCDA